MAQSQQKKPNILILWGDDIGIWNISHFSRGMMGYQTPNIDRVGEGRGDLHRLLRAAELHRRPRVLHHRPEPDSHGPDQGRHARRRRRPAARKTRPLPKCSSRWATPPASSARTIWATETNTCRRARLRRILRQSLSPERRGRTGTARLSQRIRNSRRGSVPAACSTAWPRWTSNPLGRVRRSRTPVR